TPTTIPCPTGTQRTSANELNDQPREVDHAVRTDAFSPAPTGQPHRRLRLRDRLQRTAADAAAGPDAGPAVAQAARRHPTLDQLVPAATRTGAGAAHGAGDPASTDTHDDHRAARAGAAGAGRRGSRPGRRPGVSAPASHDRL